MRAVADSPGSRSGGGFCKATTTLKSFASCPLEVVCAVETPVERSKAFLPISLTTPWNFCFGMASMVTSAGWPNCTLTMSLSSTFTSAVMIEVSAIVIRRVLDAGDDGFAFAHRDIGDDSVERCFILCFA